MSNIDKTKLTNEAVSANIKVENALTYINIQCVIDRSYQRTYANDKNLVTSLTNGVMESGFKVFAQGLQNGISLGEVGLKKFNETEYTLPGGQHRRIFLQLFALQVLKRLRKFKNETKEYEILKSILFMSGDLEDRSDSFKTRLVNEKTVDKTDFENAIKVIGDFVSSKSMLLSEDLPKTEICKNQYLETFEQIGQIIVDKEEDLDLNQSLNQKDFALFLYGSLKNTWLIVTYLGENDSEAEYYKNTFNPSRIESEADRTRVVSLVFCKQENKEELMELVEQSKIMSESLFTKSKVLTDIASLMRVALLNVTTVNSVVTLRPSYDNSISNILTNKYKNEELSPIVFYKELIKLLELFKKLDSKTNTLVDKKLRFISLFINNIGEGKYRQMPIFMKIVEQIVNNEHFASIEDIYNYVVLMSSYIINRSVVLGGNTEKQADLFFFNLFMDIKNLQKNKLSDINNYISNEIKKANLISNKKVFFERLSDKKFSNNTKLFVILKSLVAVNHCFTGSDSLEENLINTSEFINSGAQIEHFISQSPEKVLSKIKSGVAKHKLVDKIKDFTYSPANCFLLPKKINIGQSNDLIDLKLKYLNKNSYLLGDYSLKLVMEKLNKDKALSEIKSVNAFENFHEQILVKQMNKVLETGMIFAD